MPTDDFLSTKNLPAETVDIGQRLSSSSAFEKLFAEGMSLVEETANYLDGDGRKESRDLGRAGRLTYASESMRLTTRLMQSASWLLMQRSINDGESFLDSNEDGREKFSLGRLSTAMSGSGWEELPEIMRSLVERSIRLQSRIMHLESMLSNGGAPDSSDNPVADRLNELSLALGARVE